MMKQNLKKGDSVDRWSPSFLAPGRPGKECGAKAPDWPHYRCSRKAGHGGDHAAHGGDGIKGSPIVQYARWRDE